MQNNFRRLKPEIVTCPFPLYPNLISSLYWIEALVTRIYIYNSTLFPQPYNQNKLRLAVLRLPARIFQQVVIILYLCILSPRKTLRQEINAFSHILHIKWYTRVPLISYILKHKINYIVSLFNF